ncbi:MAG TPA: hypothetical protein VFX49_04490, partial [Chloroflexota bacterium]|nr:hypothetical protein [Chloroflexota bacterium]
MESPSSVARVAPAAAAELGLSQGVSRFTPVRQFTLLVGAALIVGTLALGGALAWLLQRHLEQETIKLTQQEVEVHFRDVFGDSVFTGPLDTAVAARFDPMVKTHFTIYDIVQLRLYTTNGQMIYNYLPGLIPPAGTPPEAFAQQPVGLSEEHLSHIRRASTGQGLTERTS